MVEQFKAQDLFTPKLAVYTLGLLGLCCWEVLERLGTLSGAGHILIQFPGFNAVCVTLGPSSLVCLSPPLLRHHPCLNGNTGVSLFPRISGKSFPTEQFNAFGIDFKPSRLKTYWCSLWKAAGKQLNLRATALISLSLYGNSLISSQLRAKHPANSSASACILKVCDSNGQHQIEEREWRPSRAAVANMLFILN